MPNIPSEGPRRNQIRLANGVVDETRRRVQQTTGHRGRKGDPLYDVRKLLLISRQRLTGALSNASRDGMA